MRTVRTLWRLFGALNLWESISEARLPHLKGKHGADHGLAVGVLPSVLQSSKAQ